jgi:predicted nucleic acid-binding protein
VVAEIALERVGVEDAVVPAVWWFEVRNLLIANERRGRIDPAGTGMFLAHLARLPIAVDRAPDSGMVMTLARQHGLTVYDAAYLEVALRLVLPLATLDRALAAAAPAAGVELLTA